MGLTIRCGFLIFVALCLFEASAEAACCKTCGPTSKACGDSCISLSFMCHQPPGCACNGSGSGGGGGGNPSPKPTAKPTPPSTPKKPKFTRTSDTMELPLNSVDQGNGKICSYIVEDARWKPGRILKNGEFLLLEIEIRNVNRLVKFYSGEKSVKYAKIKQGLKRKLKVVRPICDALPPPG